MKYCSSCGNELAEEAILCPKCGCAVEDKAPKSVAPAAQFKTNRNLITFILLTIVTFGIYAIVVYSKISTEINTVASRYDGKKTMHFCLVAFVFSWLTLGIVPIVWQHKISARIGDEAKRRGVYDQFGASTFWLWGVLGALIVVGPFIYTHRLLKAMNLINADYNVNG